MAWFSKSAQAPVKAVQQTRAPAPPVGVAELRHDVVTLLGYNAEVSNVRLDPDAPSRLEIMFKTGDALVTDLDDIHKQILGTASGDRARVLSDAVMNLIAAGRSPVLTPEDQTRILPLLHRIDDMPRIDQMVSARFSKTLQVVFAIPDPSDPNALPDFLTRTSLKEMAVTTDGLMPLSINNLSAYAKGKVTVQKIDDTPFSKVDMDGKMESSLMLHAPFWTSMADQSNGVLAACPARGVVILAPDHPTCITKYGATLEKLGKDSPHHLSEKLWRWTGQGWKQVKV